MNTRPVPDRYPVSVPYGYSPDYPENAGKHYGVDYATPIGTLGGSRVDGVVVISEDNYPQETRVVDGITIGRGYWGSYIEVQAADGALYGYCHLSARYAAVGAVVNAGEAIYETGDTGRTYGAHLHEHKIVDGRRIDPGAPASADAAQTEEASMARTAEHQRTIDVLWVNANQRLYELERAASALGITTLKEELQTAISEINGEVDKLKVEWPE